MRNVMIVAAILVNSLIAHSETTITNNTIGFTINLPDNWTCTQTNDSTAVFNDTTLEYQSQAVIKKYNRNQDDYSTPDDWTRAHFIAYLLVTDYSYDPFGAVLFYDSTSSCKQGEFWAAEAFSEFYTLDTVLGAWNEYIRYTAAGDFGYSLYAIGDTSDMKKNIGMYAAILQSISIVEQTASIGKVKPAYRNGIIKVKPEMSSYTFDLAGRRQMSASQSHLVIVRKWNGSIFTSVMLK